MALTSTAYSVANQEPSWRTFGCENSTARWRFLPDGSVEVDGKGVQASTWKPKVDQWRDQIVAAAVKHGVPAAWIAAVMTIESGGDDKSCRKVDGVCSTREGVGLMAILASTATMLEKRKITNDDLLNDPALNVDLGAKYIRLHLDSAKVGGDFVKASVAYNAGGVRCGTGSTWEQKEPCPPTVWGVVMGCTLASKDYGGCAPSTLSPGKYKCPNNYPGIFIKALNAAIANGWGDMPPGVTPPGPDKEQPVWPSYLDQAGPPSRFLWMVAAGVAGYLGVVYLPRLIKRPRAYR